MRGLALTLLLIAPASAQLASYDAGTAGAPPVAPDPATQGWSVTLDSGVNGTPISPDGATGFNAWEVSDTSAVGGATYQCEFGSAQANDGYARGFEYTVVLRMTAGSPSSIYFSYTDGYTFTDNLYAVAFAIVGNDVVATDQWSNTNFVCAGAMDGGDHAFGMRLQPGTFVVEFVYDGQVLGSIAGGIPPQPQMFQGVRWGALGDGTGRARFQRVEFRYLDDLGTTSCNPAVPNSTGSAASIGATGSLFVLQNFLEITATELPPNQFGYLLASLHAGFTQNPGGSQGNLCLSGNIGRFVGQVQSSGAVGAFTVPVDLSAIPTTPVASVAAGETWNFQAWYRDQNPASTSNFTNALRIEFR